MGMNDKDKLEKIVIGLVVALCLGLMGIGLYIAAHAGK